MYNHASRKYLILSTGLISRRVDIFFPLRYYEGKCRREWDLNKKAIFHVPRDYFPPIHFTSTK